MKEVISVSDVILYRVLKNNNCFSEDDFAYILETAAENGWSYEKTIVSIGLMSESDICRLFADEFK